MALLIHFNLCSIILHVLLLLSVAGVVVCLQGSANDLHTVQLMPLPPHPFLLQ